MNCEGTYMYATCMRDIMIYISMLRKRKFAKSHYI